ncbi:MAG TPA: Gfo/Idh/MocA family oxidoreductase [Burkholderiales bacterium]|nr:Gfo/Idh/MocA family oxidoreductase [Burkholderiales bacterium]
MSSAAVSSRRLRAAVVGVGYLGRFHAQKYAALPDVELAGVVDASRERAEQVAAECGTRAFNDPRDVLVNVDVVSIVVPTERHFEVARTCLEAGAHILLEKPVTQTVAEAETLIRLARERGRVFQVGHLERFNPAMLAAQPLLAEPLFVESHRLAPFKPRGTDVDVVLDLMIHDIDIILSMVHSDIADIRSTGFPVLTDEVDIAHARIEFANGCVANVTASRVSQMAMRKVRVFQHDSYLSIDYHTRKVAVVRRVGMDAGQPRLEMEEREFPQADALLEEVRAFLDSVRRGAEPAVSGEDGRRALEVALRINQGMRAPGANKGEKK